MANSYPNHLCWATYGITHTNTQEMHMCISNTCYILRKSFLFFFFFSVTRGEVQSIAGSRHRTAVPLFLWFPWSCHPPWFGFIVRLLARWLQELPGFTSRSNNFHRKKNKRTTPPCIYFLGRGNLSQQPPSALFTFHWPWLDHIPIDFLPYLLTNGVIESWLVCINHSGERWVLKSATRNPFLLPKIDENAHSTMPESFQVHWEGLNGRFHDASQYLLSVLFHVTSVSVCGRGGAASWRE